MTLKVMIRPLQLLAIAIAALMVSCTDEPKDLLQTALASENALIKKVMDSIEGYEVQIRYTQITRRNDSVLFTDFDFQVDGNNYFYPASTVKFPASVAALEKLNEIDTLDRNTKFYIEGDSIETTFARAITEIFAVSDNAANNRLVEFLGQDGINERMRKRGVNPIRISHRLSVDNAYERTTKPLVIYLNDSTTATTQPILSANFDSLQIANTKKGIGFMEDGALVNKPFAFALKNYYPIKAQHALLKRIVFPEAFPEAERFNLSAAQHEFLLNTMSILPKAAGYDTEEHYDSFGKFFMFGDSEKPIPPHIKIYNKVGYAYGTLTDCAYIKDSKNNVEFMVTATILVNNDGVFNDNKYEYDDVGIPFLAQLGRELYEQELKRER